jgi:hypothetical protein
MTEQMSGGWRMVPSARRSIGAEGLHVHDLRHTGNCSAAFLPHEGKRHGQSGGKPTRTAGSVSD